MSDSLTTLIPTPSLVSPTIFNAGPNDALAAVDAYGTSAGDVINNLAGLLSSFDSSILDTVASDLDALADLAGAVLGDVAAFAVDTGLMASRIGALTGGNRAYLATVTANILANLVAGNGLNAATANAVTVQIGNVVTRTNSNNPSDVQSFVALLNGLMGSGATLASVIDDGASTSLLAGAMISCIGMGLSSLIPNLLTSVVASLSAAAITAALIAAAPWAVAAGDLVALSAILNCNQGEGQPSGGWCIELAVPNAVPLILRNYHMPKNTPPQLYNPYLNQLLFVMTGIDPDWASINRNGTLVNNLLALIGASSDSLTLLKTEEQYLVMATIAGNFPGTDPVGIAPSMYPNLYFPANSQASAYGTTNGSTFAFPDTIALPA